MKLIAPTDPKLTTPCQAIDDVTEMAEAITKMARLLKSTRGVGLAAPQVGLSVQIFLTDVPNNPSQTPYVRMDGKTVNPSTLRPLVFINPKVELSGKTIEGPEGCLSLPGRSFQVPRHLEARVTALHANRKPFVLETQGFFARVIQHEFDHLQGLLISRFPEIS